MSPTKGNFALKIYVVKVNVHVVEYYFLLEADPQKIEYQQKFHLCPLPIQVNAVYVLI